MIDVFVKVWAESAMRGYMALAVIERLRMFEDAHVTILLAENSWPVQWPLLIANRIKVVERDEFWITSKEHADRTAGSPIYVVIDDDHLPIGKEWLAQGVAALEARPEFGMLASWSINGEVPEGASDDPDVFPTTSVGCPYFCRRQSLGELPDGPLESYDQVLSEHVKKNVGRIGFLKNVRHNHLGYGLSQVVPEWWLA